MEFDLPPKNDCPVISGHHMWPCRIWIRINGEAFSILIPEEKPCDQNPSGGSQLHSFPLSPNIHLAEEDMIASLAASACQRSMKQVRCTGRGLVDPR